MISKTLGTLLILIACILMLPIAFAILGGVFGIIFGVIGGVFGAVFGIIGGVFGAILGFFEWVFDGLFGWNHGPSLFWNWNPFTVFLFMLIVALIVRSQSKRNEKTP
jgi:hypothetical protein